MEGLQKQGIEPYKIDEDTVERARALIRDD